mgnify:CR=1 FL=1
MTKYFDSNLDLADYIRNALNKFSISVLKQADDFIVNLPSKLINFFVMFFVIFYLFKDGKSLVDKLKKECRVAYENAETYAKAEIKRQISWGNLGKRRRR